MKKVKMIAMMFAFAFTLVGAFAFSTSDMQSQGVQITSCNFLEDLNADDCIVGGNGSPCTVISTGAQAYTSGCSNPLARP